MNRMENKRKTYRARWDSSTWGMIGLVGVCCVCPLIFDDDGLLPVLVCVGMLALVIVCLLSVYYRIEGDQLLVYTFFIPHAYLIGKITEVYRIKTYLSAPATSLTRRLAIRFSDKSVLKSIDPLVISPADEKEFIGHLLEINRGIKVSPDLDGQRG